MAIKLTGFLKVKLGEEILKISADDFSLEEGGDRNIGDGDQQYECLYVYRHGTEFSVEVELTRLDGQVNIYPLTITGEAKIVDDHLKGI